MKEHISEVSKLVLQVKPRGLMPLTRFLLIEAAQVFKAALKVLRRQQRLSHVGFPKVQFSALFVSAPSGSVVLTGFTRSHFLLYSTWFDF